MQHLIAQSEACLETGNFTQEDFNLARFAVFAWVDEAILSSAWEGRKQWQREQLQRHYFQTADAGELFFERLNTIGPHQRDVREVYYLVPGIGLQRSILQRGG
jgi:type VI secretion system protein ImpK